MRDLHPCPPCGRQGRPGQGFLAGFIERPRGSAPRERDHRGGDHPVPSRTRQLSPPSPRVLQREAAGGQGVALAEGAFLCLRGSAREEMRGGAPHAPGEARRGMLPPAGLFAFRGGRGVARGVAPARDTLSRRGAPAGRARLRYTLEAGFLSLCAASRFSFLLVPKRLIDSYNFRTMYS